MASCSSSSFPDIWAWIQNLPPTIQWQTNSMSICICSSSTNSCQPSLELSISYIPNSSSFSFSILANFSYPISLWTSKSIKLDSKSSTNILDDEAVVSKLLINIIKDIVNYSPVKSSYSFLRLPKIESIPDLRNIFNFLFLSLAFIISIYEAPQDIRCDCLKTLKDQFTCSWSRETSKIFVRLVGSNTEEQWMRSINLAITNLMVELQAMNHTLKAPSPLYSYAVSTLGLWKVQLYCPVITMDIGKCSSPGPDEKLLFSLNHHQVEGVIQLNHQVMIREKWIDVMVSVDNIRCDVIRLVDNILMNERGAGVAEKHFPSRISLQLTPTMQTNVLSISVSKSSENPTREIGVERGIEGSIEPPNPYIGLKVSSTESVVTSLKPWKFEQSVYGDTAVLNWFLHDSMDGREVFSTKPSKFALLKPKAWFKNRYSNAYRPFTRQGGIIFAGDEYGESVLWKVDKGATMKKTMEWELKGCIWLTYWPNKYKTFYTETRKLEFSEILCLTLA